MVNTNGGNDIPTVGKYETPARAYIGRFNFKGADQGKIVGQLSGGERGRLHLAQTLISGGNVLLLDEPSNDLDVETLRALEDALLEFAGCVAVISRIKGVRFEFIFEIMNNIQCKYTTTFSLTPYSQPRGRRLLLSKF